MRKRKMFDDFMRQLDEKDKEIAELEEQNIPLDILKRDLNRFYNALELIREGDLLKREMIAVAEESLEEWENLSPSVEER